MSTRMETVRDDLYKAMRSREVDPDDGSLYQLASDLLVCTFPEAPTPEKLDAFSLLVGFAAGSAVEKYGHDEPAF